MTTCNNNRIKDSLENKERKRTEPSHTTDVEVGLQRGKIEAFLKREVGEKRFRERVTCVFRVVLFFNASYL